VTVTDRDAAVSAARAAGEVLLRYWNTRDTITPSRKGAGDFVSDADVEAEKSLRENLLSERPGDGWLGEESGEVSGTSRRWIVDPLDGTTNFLRGIPHWAVSVALEEDGELVLGVIHDPVKGETFQATRGEGAWMNGTPLVGSSTETMSDALFGTGLPFGAMAHIDDHAEDLRRLLPQCAGMRRMGSAALDLAYVAAGRLDGFWERKLQLWDIAAGLVIAREAGLRVEGWTAEEAPEESGSVVTSNPALFTTFAGIIRGQNH